MIEVKLSSEEIRLLMDALFSGLSQILNLAVPDERSELDDIREAVQSISHVSDRLKDLTIALAEAERHELTEESYEVTE